MTDTTPKWGGGGDCIEGYIVDQYLDTLFASAYPHQENYLGKRGASNRNTVAVNFHNIYLLRNKEFVRYKSLSTVHQR
jgi:hypothetical protein